MAGRDDAPATKVACPTCGKPVAWGATSPERPFCSRRCRLIDLGEWLDGSRTIPGEDAEGIDAGSDEPVRGGRH